MIISMKRTGDSFELSASDLIGYLNCRHLAALDCAVAKGALAKPKICDSLLDILRERGAIHEHNYVEHLAKAGLKAVRIDGIEVTDAAVSETLAAMKAGAPVIVQAALAHDGWVGRADILRRVEKPSALGAWSYEPVDTKLARETRAGSVLQLCLYADLMADMQGLAPEYMYVVVPWSDFEPQHYRYADYAAYFRKVKRGMVASLAAKTPQDAARRLSRSDRAL
jgi:predicted RecB family nuclease